MKIAWTGIEITLTFVPKGLINNNPALDQIMAWRRPGNRSLSETIIASSQTLIFTQLDFNDLIRHLETNLREMPIGENVTEYIVC